MQKGDCRRFLKVICTWEGYAWDETLVSSEAPTEFDGFWLCVVPELSITTTSASREDVPHDVRVAIEMDAFLGHGIGVSAVTALGLGDGEFDLDVEFVVADNSDSGIG